MTEKTVKKKRKKRSSDRDIIVLDHVSKSYETGSPALNDINLRIRQGEFVFIVGDSGSGKSTMIKLLLRELSATEGNVRVLGYDLNRIRHRKIPEFRRNIGIVFQDFRLLKDRNVYENVAFAQRIVQTPAKQMRKNVPAVLASVGLAGKYKAKPKQLSGGEQQRVSIARALAKNPKLLLCDEPTGALDSKTSRDILALLEKVNEKYGTTMLIVTHNNSIKNMVHRVIRIKDGIINSEYTNETRVPAVELEDL